MTEPADNAPARPAKATSAERVRVLANTDPQRTFDHDKIEAGVRQIFEGLGLGPSSPGIKDTPGRVARMYDEGFAGLLVDPAGVLDVVFQGGHAELVLIRGLSVSSTGG